MSSGCIRVRLKHSRCHQRLHRFISHLMLFLVGKVAGSDATAPRHQMIIIYQERVCVCVG